MLDTILGWLIIILIMTTILLICYIIRLSHIQRMLLAKVTDHSYDTRRIRECIQELMYIHMFTEKGNI